MSELKKMTRLGGDVRKIAALLQAKAPKGEMLAYINPEEAALLKARGGSGKPHADTGIPSFEVEGDFGFGGYDLGGFNDIAAADQSTFAPEISAPPVAGGFTAAPAAGGYTLAQDFGGGVGARLGGVQGLQAPESAFATPSLPTSPRYDISGVGIPAPESPVPQKPTEGGMSKDTLARLGLAGGLGLLGMSTAGRAQAAGRRGAEEMQALARPYQTAGLEAQQKAQRGELMPAGQQSLQAAQAQIAQDIQRRGGVGAQQAVNQVEALRQQLLQQQYDYGLKLSGIGDNIALGAIRTGLQADQVANQLTNSFFTNMAYIASGMSPGLRIG